MRISGQDADKLSKRPPDTWKAVLLHGANAGLVGERADALARAVVPDLKDAFRITELSGETLKRDPARLADEAAAISMFGGRRVVRVRDAADALAQLFETFLGSDSGDTLVVIEAGELSKASNLRKLFEGARNAAGIECADDSASDTARLIEESLAAQGWKITPEAQAYLVDALGPDRRLLRTELDKLLLYLGEAGEAAALSRADVSAVIGGSGDVESDEIADAVADGDLRRLDALIAKGNESGLSWGVALGFTLRLFQRLAAGIEGAGPMWGKMQSQAAGWDRPRIRLALAILSEAEARTRTTGFPEAVMAQQALIDVARRRPARKA
ncbi:MAG: DNA polymerase III subunit delta [Alphaproteobacteria bacterium]